MSDILTTSWHRLPKCWSLGHRMVRDLFKDPCIIEEKVDGSSFSFGVYGGELRWRSKDVEMNAADMFKKAIDTIKEKAPLLREGWRYSGEYLSSPKHNTLCYERTPKDYIAIFDISPSQETYLSYHEKVAEASRLGFETVPLLFEGIPTEPLIQALMARDSYLGKVKIEGVVIKNYARFAEDDGKALMGKYVSEAFKEVHRVDWKVKNPLQGDILHNIITTYRTEARWHKAIQHLKERALITNSPKDIGPLCSEVVSDTFIECKDAIQDALFKWAWEKLKRELTYGVAVWYKEQLLKLQFKETSSEAVDSLSSELPQVS